LFLKKKKEKKKRAKLKIRDISEITSSSVERQTETDTHEM
jgi:hypothetical protein